MVPKEGLVERRQVSFNEKYLIRCRLCTKSTNEVFNLLGSLHDNGLKIDNKNCLQVKFKAKSSLILPTPTSYITRNIVCEKIEMEVKDDEIDANLCWLLLHDVDNIRGD